jgi:hypothetical protein
MRSIDKETYLVTNQEVFNFLGKDGDEYASRSHMCGFLYPQVGKLIEGTGRLTYLRADEIFGTRQKGNKRKPLCNMTYLLYDKKSDTYYVEYEGMRLITIHRHGWTIEVPQSTHILYPGYINRVRLYTGVSIFKSNRNIVCLGSFRHSSVVMGGKSVFVDYSFTFKNPYGYMGHGFRTNVTKINRRKYTRTNWCRDDQIENGRNYSLTGNTPRATMLLRDVIKRYVVQYLTGHCLSHNKVSFESFCNDSSSSYSTVPHSRGGTKVDILFSNTHKEKSYLERTELYDIDTLFALQKVRSNVVSSMASYGVLLQAMFCLRGLQWLPNKKRVEKVINSYTTSYKLKEKDPSEYLSHPFIDNKTLSSYEHPGRYWEGGNMLTYYQHSMEEPLFAELSLRRGLLGEFLSYLMNTSSGGHPKVFPQTRSYAFSNPRNTHRSDEISERAKAITYRAGVFLDFIGEEDRGSQRYRWSRGTTNYSSMLDRSLRDQNGSTQGQDDYVLYADMDNPFPRMFFFIMLDEYISDSILGKREIVSLLEYEWDVLAQKPAGEGDIESDMPMSFDIMHSFLTKCLSGIFLPLLTSANGCCGNSWHEHPHLINYGTVDTTRGWYHDRNAQQHTCIPPERLVGNLQSVGVESIDD